MTTFIYRTDPGHGWLEVTTDDLADVGIPLSWISPCSYMRGDTLFLEEDCDATLFVAAYKAKHGVKPEFKEHHTSNDSPIRFLPRTSGTHYSYELWRMRLARFEQRITVPKGWDVVTV